MEKVVFASRLKESREAVSLSQSKLAEMLGVSRFAIMDWEKGKTTPKLATLERLAAILQTTVAYLSGESYTPAPAETAAAQQPDAQPVRAAFAQRESAERCENSMSVPRAIVLIAQLRAYLSELDPDAIAEPDRRTMSDLLAACQRAIPPAQRAPEEIEEREKPA